MRDEKRAARMREIETEAYALFSAAGFEATSMLAVAKRAKASNETLYRWYGDKHGLFESMVQANADHVQRRLTEALEADDTPMQTLAAVAEALLAMLLSERAIVLNRAAASDPTGALGKLLTQAGREAVLPLVQKVLRDAVAAGALGKPEEDLGALFVKLLVGDQQIRRVIGALGVPSSEEVAAQTERALAQLQVLCPVSAARAP